MYNLHEVAIDIIKRGERKKITFFMISATIFANSKTLISYIYKLALDMIGPWTRIKICQTSQVRGWQDQTLRPSDGQCQGNEHYADVFQTLAAWGHILQHGSLG